MGFFFLKDGNSLNGAHAPGTYGQPAPAETRRNNNVIIASKRRRSDVIMLLLRRLPSGADPSDKQIRDTLHHQPPPWPRKGRVRMVHRWAAFSDTSTYIIRAGSRFAPSQWETALLCNDVSHWLGTSLEKYLILKSLMHPIEALTCVSETDIKAKDT